MTEKQARVWKNQECKFFACADREYQDELKKQLEDKTQEYNSLHKKVKEMEELLDNKEDSTKTETERVVTENLSLRRSESILKSKLQTSNTNAEILSIELEQIKAEIRAREEKDLATIEEISTIDKRVKEKRDELKKLDASLYIKKKEEEVLEQVLVKAKEHLSLQKEEINVLEKSKTKLSHEVDIYSKEMAHNKKYYAPAAKKVKRKMDQIQNLMKRGKVFRAKKKFIEVKQEVMAMPEVERKNISNEYAEVIRQVQEASDD